VDGTKVVLVSQDSAKSDSTESADALENVQEIRELQTSERGGRLLTGYCIRNEGKATLERRPIRRALYLSRSATLQGLTNVRSSQMKRSSKGRIRKRASA